MFSIIGVGDIMPGGILSGKKDGFIDKEVLTILNSANFRIGTLETAIGNEPNWFNEKMQRTSDVIYSKDEDIYKLLELNINIVSLANNHIFDLGPEGIRHTIELLDSIGIQHCGAGMNIEEASRPVVVNCDGKSIAFSAFCDWRRETTGWCLMASENSAGVNPLYETHVEEQIKLLKSKYDYVVIIPHWGIEHISWPTKNVYYMVNKMITWGADVIFGGHTHRIQPVISSHNKSIAYSLGNFLFSDRIIIPPRSTWYPDNNFSEYCLLPITHEFPFVEEPTLKCSPFKDRIGLINKVSINDGNIESISYYTFMNDNCHLSLYHGLVPSVFAKICIGSGLYPFISPIIYQLRRFRIITKNIFSKIMKKTNKR